MNEDKNMEIWDKVSQTDVDHTKEVSFGRKFTAIDAHSQIMNATKLFGAVGHGWGYQNVYGEIHMTDGRILAWCDVTFWWTAEGRQWEGNPGPTDHCTFGPVRGGAMLQSLNKDGSFKTPDTDAYKKASTDGLTKLLSHLGFNADVFLGMFDDNKYVQGLQKEKDATQTASQELYAQERSGFIKKIEACTTGSKMDGVLADYKNWIDRLPAGTAVELRAWVLKQKGALKDKK